MELDADGLLRFHEKKRDQLFANYEDVIGKELPSAQTVFLI